ncbi:MAG: proline dehydrogenase family protein, partial [Flavobacteriales bacterium]|nr:proline dehydrogenase family protein [Flavobacteriales bacterium]
GWAVNPTIFSQFCGGETIEECAGTTQVLDQHGIGTILDYSVEGKHNDETFDSTTKEILSTISTANQNKHIPFCVFKMSGITRFGLLMKMNEGEALTESELAEKDRLIERLNSICSSAKNAQTPVFIDAEESWIQDAIDSLAWQMIEKYNEDEAWVYNTVQLYRHDRLDYLKDTIAIAKEKQRVLGVKLVRGAYMEKERDRAEDLGYKDPIQPNKESSDQDFDLALKECVQNLDMVRVVAGTHNEASSLYLTKLIHENGIEKSDQRIYFAQLFGMSDHISFNLSDMGYNVAKYVPYGPIREVIPYLIRRAEENTSVKGQTGRELSLIMKEMKRRKGIKS